MEAPPWLPMNIHPETLKQNIVGRRADIGGRENTCGSIANEEKELSGVSFQ